MNTDARHALDAWLHRADDLLADADTPLPADRADSDEGPELIDKLWVRLHKERDLELHVRVGWLAAPTSSSCSTSCPAPAATGPASWSKAACSAGSWPNSPHSTATRRGGKR